MTVLLQVTFKAIQAATQGLMTVTAAGGPERYSVSAARTSGCHCGIDHQSLPTQIYR